MNVQNVADIYPLSPMQQGILFHTLAEPGTEAYFEQVSCVLHGDLDVAAFKRTWQRLVELHTPLRTCFLWEELDEPLQVVLQQVHARWIEEDWRMCSSTEQQTRLAIFLQEDRQQGFSLTRAPLMRLILLRLAENAYHFTWSYHHLLLDGWSTTQILGEMLALYEAYRAGSEISIPVRPPYREYITWLQQQDHLAAETFWRSALRGFNAPTQLQIERPVAEQLAANTSYGELVVHCSQESTVALQMLTRQQKITLNTLAQGAWALLLSHYGDTDDVVFGSVVSGRPVDLPDVESMVGLFINTQPMRVRVMPEARLFPWLRAFQDWQAQARQYDYASLVEVQKWSEISRGSALFQSLVVFENYPFESLNQDRESSLEVRDAHAVERTNYPLNIVFDPGTCLHIRAIYDARRFEHQSIERLLNHLLTILNSIAAQPEQRLMDVPYLSEEERRLLLVAWNQTQTAYPSDRTLSQLFAAQVVRTPDAIALAFEESQLSYREIDQRANQLAYHLRSLGVGPEVLVGLFLERCPEMMLAILAILKAGGAYLPLDPSYPADRIAFMLDDAVAPVLITQRSLLASLPVHQAAVVCLERDHGAITAWPGSPCEDFSRPENLAYVIYTSGSTGRPKGISIPQQAVARLLFETNYIRLRPGDFVAQASNASFDAATFEIWGALLHGGRLVGITREMNTSLHAFATHLHRYGVEILFLTTALFNQLAREEPHTFERLRYLLFGGEAVEPRWVRSVLKHGPPGHLLHVYGPTESTTFASWHQVEEVAEGVSTVPIGRPLANTEFFVLDRYLQPVGVGIPGELYIGRDGLARGYLHCSDVTAARFIPHPFSTSPGARLYRTGDLVRYRSNGQIEFIERIDQQIKIRGFRVEPGEIEAALRDHPAVREVVVILRQDQPGVKRLVAYLVTQPDQSVTVAELRSYLQAQLPSYMVPGAYVLLSSLPLNPNGKVERKALPPPDMERSTAERVYIAPRTPLEERFAQIWSQTLRIERIGIADNFFELGGDSILCFQIVARANEAGINLRHKHIFDHQTIATLATCADLTDPVSREAVIEAEGGLVPLSPIQCRFFEQDMPQPHHWNMSLLLQMPNVLSPVLLEKVVFHLLHHHPQLRARFHRRSKADRGTAPAVIDHTLQDMEWQQVIGEPDEIIYCPAIDLSSLSANVQAEALEKVTADLQRGLNLTTGPLVRIALLLLGPGQECRLMIVVHHLVIDGVSWRIVLEDLQTACSQLSRREPIRLLPEMTSFAGWSARLHNYARPELLQRALTFWREMQRCAPPALPLDISGGRNTEASALLYQTRLSDEETRALLQEVPGAYQTRIDMVLLTALAQTWQHWTGSSTLLVDLEGHGREPLFDEDLDLSRTVGWFTALYPLLLEFDPTQGPGEHLKAIKEQVLALPDRGLSYGVLRYLCSDPDLRKEMQSWPGAALSFNYLGQFDQSFTQEAFLGLASEAYGADRDPDALRWHILSLNSIITNGQLILNWSYSANLHDRETIMDIANFFMQALRGLISHCLSPEAGGYTPSDFPESMLSQAELDAFIAEL